MELLNQGMCDGASSVILATEDACVKYNLKPLARILAYSFAGKESLVDFVDIKFIQSLLKTFD